MSLQQLTALLGAMAWLGSAAALACDCVGEPKPSPLDGSNVVVHGRVLSASESDGNRVYELEVREMFQGFPRSRLKVYSAGTSCQTKLEVGSEYLLHAFARDEAGRTMRGAFSINMCTRKVPFAQVSREELETLRRRRATQRANATGITFGLP